MLGYIPRQNVWLHKNLLPFWFKNFCVKNPVARLIHWSLPYWPWSYSSSQSPSSCNNVSWCPGCMGQYWSQQASVWLVEIRRSRALIGRQDHWIHGGLLLPGYCRNHCPLWRFSMEQMGRKTQLIPFLGKSQRLTWSGVRSCVKLSINESTDFFCFKVSKISCSFFKNYSGITEITTIVRFAC